MQQSTINSLIRDTLDMKIVTPDDKWQILSTLKKYKMVCPHMKALIFMFTKMTL